MSSSLQKQLNQLNDTFFALTLRERTLILIAGLALILLGGFVTFIEPDFKQATKVNRDARAKQSVAREIEAQVGLLQNQLKADPNVPLRQRLEELRRRIVLLDENLASHTQDLVPAEKMPELLERVLSKSQKLNLVSLDSIAPIQVLKAEETQNTEGNFNLYQHGVRLVLEGRYFEIQHYLEQLEQLPWRFYWKVFSYQVEEYPSASVELELYTLSTSSAFIGVGQND